MVKDRLFDRIDAYEKGDIDLNDIRVVLKDISRALMLLKLHAVDIDHWAFEHPWTEDANMELK